MQDVHCRSCQHDFEAPDDFDPDDEVCPKCQSSLLVASPREDLEECDDPLIEAILVTLRETNHLLARIASLLEPQVIKNPKKETEHL